MSHPLLRPLEELIAAWRERSDDAEKDAKLDEEFEQGNSAKAYWIGKCVEDLERVLRESGLADLLEAGQAQVRDLLTKHEYLNGACLCREWKLPPYGKKEFDDFRAEQGNDWMTDIRWRYWLEHVLAALAKVKGKSA